MQEAVDVTKVREAPMLDIADWNTGFDLFETLVHRESFPEERPSLAQQTALLEILRCGFCKVDLALWAGETCP